MMSTISLDLQECVVAVAEEMNTAPWLDKLLEAMDFVLKEEVDLEKGTVTSGVHGYEVDPVYGCCCPDARIRSRYCKHFVAIEMQKRVNTRLKGEAMPAKTNPQTEWETGVQNGQEAELFGSEPDDIPEPTVPTSGGQIAPPQYSNGPVRTEGHQYVDHPSTLCIKRQVGSTEIMWTFRGSLDEEVWGRASRMIRTLDEASKRYVPQQAEPKSSGQVAPPPESPSMPAAEKAVNHGPQPDSPYCRTHGVFYDRWSKGNRQWDSHKGPDGAFCNAPRNS